VTALFELADGVFVGGAVGGLDFLRRGLFSLPSVSNIGSSCFQE
jgi:hypothetical protein